MIQHIVKCEMCKSQFPFDLHRTLECQSPDGWLIVFQGGTEGQEPSHFCSKLCLQAWLVQLAQAQGDYQSLRETEHIPYEYCCIKHYPMPRKKTGDAE